MGRGKVYGIAGITGVACENTYGHCARYINVIHSLINTNFLIRTVLNSLLRFALMRLYCIWHTQSSRIQCKVDVLNFNKKTFPYVQCL